MDEFASMSMIIMHQCAKNVLYEKMFYNTLADIYYTTYTLLILILL